MAINYKDSGVDIDATDRFIDSVKGDIHTTHGPQVLGGIGGFGGAYLLEASRYKEPVLISGTDGVGTKLKLAFQMNRHDTVGIDLVAMSVNDILTLGAKPLFFLDYYATSRLELEVSKKVIHGIVTGCKQAGCALLGGETAELPDFYKPNEYDLAGFAVGVVEKSEIVDGSKISPGDAVIGIKSSGAHSNGFSLIRKIFDKQRLSLTDKFPGVNQTVGDVLLTPTKIYVSTILQLMAEHPGSILGMSHITGGGLPGNLIRILPENCSMKIDWDSWQRPPVMEWIYRAGELSLEEFRSVFNCGIGYVLVVEASKTQPILTSLRKLGEQSFLIGEIIKNRGTQEIQFVGDGS